MKDKLLNLGFKLTFSSTDIPNIRKTVLKSQSRLDQEVINLYGRDVVPSKGDIFGILVICIHL